MTYAALPELPAEFAPGAHDSVSAHAAARWHAEYLRRYYGRQVAEGCIEPGAPCVIESYAPEGAATYAAASTELSGGNWYCEMRRRNGGYSFYYHPRL